MQNKFAVTPSKSALTILMNIPRSISQQNVTLEPGLTCFKEKYNGNFRMYSQNMSIIGTNVQP